MGHDVRIFMLRIPAGQNDDSQDPVWYGSAMFQSFAVFEAILPGTDVPLYLFSHPAFSPPSLLWADEDWRFTLFANGAAEFCWNYWKPEIVHCHDWHGMIPVWMHQSRVSIRLYYTQPCLSRAVDWCKDNLSLVYAGINTMAACVRPIASTPFPPMPSRSDTCLR